MKKSQPSHHVFSLLLLVFVLIRSWLGNLIVGSRLKLIAGFTFLRFPFVVCVLVRKRFFVRLSKSWHLPFSWFLDAASI